jgi:hypothetical protein
MNDQAHTLQTIAQLVERLAEQMDGIKADITGVKDSLTRFRVRELETAVEVSERRLDAGIDQLGERFDRLVKMRWALQSSDVGQLREH